MISNASPLILFAKINQIELLLKVYGTLCIHEEVYKEIAGGKKIKAPDAFIVERMVKEKKIKVEKLNESGKKEFQRLKNIYRALDIGEVATISLTLQKKENELIIDESIARKVAKLVGLKPVGSLGALLEAYKRGIISEKELKNIVRKMISTDFRVSASVIERFWELFKEMKS